MKQNANTFAGYGIFNRESGSWIKDCIPTGLGGVDYTMTRFNEYALSVNSFDTATDIAVDVSKELSSPYWGVAQIHIKD